MPDDKILHLHNYIILPLCNLHTSLFHSFKILVKFRLNIIHEFQDFSDNLKSNEKLDIAIALFFIEEENSHIFFISVHLFGHFIDLCFRVCFNS